MLLSRKPRLRKVQQLQVEHSWGTAEKGFAFAPARLRGPLLLMFCAFLQCFPGIWVVFHFTKMKFLKFSFKMKVFISIHKKRKKKNRKEKKENFLWPMEKIIRWFACWQRAQSCGPGCEREGERFSWKTTTPPTHICVSLRLTQGPTTTAQHITLVTVPTISIQIAERAEALESYHPY